MPPLVSISPSSGMGNQLFQVAATLGFAERHGYIPVFWEESHSSWEHQGSLFRVKAMFPSLRILSEEERRGPWVVLQEDWNSIFTYTPLPCPSSKPNIKLVGYFQSDLYGPSTFPTVPSPPLLSSALIPKDWKHTFFLHVRRGDYLHPSNTHHAVDLTTYWRTCLTETSMAATARLRCFVVSDDMPWCKENLRRIVGNEASLCDWDWCPETASDVETFFWMTACDAGGICANSTFSWWSAWYVRRRVGVTARLYMPKEWGKPPLPPTRHLHPAWAIVR